RRLGAHSHVLTSPPYINAQDYFRNFKLELHLLEGLLPFKVDSIRERFIGTERGDLLRKVSQSSLDYHRDILPELATLQRKDARLGAVVHKYLYEMGKALDAIVSCLVPGGVFVLVCGDNLVGGVKHRTWQSLQRMLEQRGFRLFDRFTDRIGDR